MNSLLYRPADYQSKRPFLDESIPGDEIWICEINPYSVIGRGRRSQSFQHMPVKVIGIVAQKPGVIRKNVQVPFGIDSPVQVGQHKGVIVIDRQNRWTHSNSHRQIL